MVVSILKTALKAILWCNELIMHSINYGNLVCIPRKFELMHLTLIYSTNVFMSCILISLAGILQHQKVKFKDDAS